MVQFIIINWFDRIGVCIWNIFRVRLKWKLQRVNLNITNINYTMIKSPHYSWNHSTGFGRRTTGSEVICWRLDVPLSWWFSCFFTMKGVELVHIYSNIWWDEFRARGDACISLVSNSSTSPTKKLILNAEIYNNWLVSCCVNVGVIRRTIMIRAFTWSGKCSWVSNDL